MKLHYLLCAALACPLVTHAAATAEATAGMPTFTVIDLDENDGVTPVFIWTPSNFGYNFSSNGIIPGEGNVDGGGNLIGSEMDPAAPFERQLVQDDSAAEVSANMIPGALRSRSQTSIPPIPQVAGGVDFRDLSNLALISGEFSLQGKGAVLVTLPYTLSATGNFSPEICEESGCANSQSAAGFFGEFAGQTFETADFLDTFLGQASGTLMSQEISNLSDTEILTGTFTYAVVTFAYAQSAPGVPEPETWAMLLAGLGLVGWAARRRRA